MFLFALPLFQLFTVEDTIDAKDFHGGGEWFNRYRRRLKDRGVYSHKFDKHKETKNMLIDTSRPRDPYRPQSNLSVRIVRPEQSEQNSQPSL